MRKAPLSIRFVLLALLLVSAIPMAVGLGVSAYLNSVETVKLLWRDLADELLADAQEKTLRHLEPGSSGLELNRLMVADDSLSVGDRPALLRTLRRCLASQPNVTWCSFGGSDGAYLAAYRQQDGAVRLTHREPTGSTVLQKDYLAPPGETPTLSLEKETSFDPRTRPWWKIGRSAATPTWSEPFLFASRNQPGVVLTLRQGKESQDLSGVWLMEYELSHLARFLREMKENARKRKGLLANAEVYILSKDGLVIGHPEGKTVRGSGDQAELIPAGEHGDRELRAVYRRALAGDISQRQRFQYHVGDKEYLGMSAPFDSAHHPEWTALVTIPADALLGPIRDNNRTAALIASLVALMSVLLGMALSERFVRLLTDIAHDLDRIGRLDFGDSPSRKRSLITEVEEMIAARDRMTGGLRSFSKYVPSGLVRQLVAQGQEATLGGETKELTVYFSDIVGFTSIAERLTPSALVDALAEYLGEMSNIIAEEQGTVDKYIGDAIMAFWGAPQDVDAHAVAGCRAALRCQRRLAALREEWQGSAQPEIYARIGLNTGECLVGNIGAATRMNYTVMGDPVNVASRLEAQCKNYEVEVLIGERTRSLGGNEIVARPVDKIAVKGKEQGIVVYELLGMTDDPEPNLEFERLSEEAFTAYVKGEFEESTKLYSALRKDHPGDPCIERLLQRSQKYLSSPPLAWTGITVLTSK